MTRRLLVLIIISLCFGYILDNLEIPSYSIEKSSAVSIDNSYQERREERQVEAWREALAQTVAQVMKVDIELSRQIACGLYQASLEYDVRPMRLAALIAVESLGNPNATSSANARGLMQILPRTGKFVAQSLGEEWRGTKSLHEVETSIVYGAWYYAHLKERFPGNERAALAAYNWGPENIEFRLRRKRRLPSVYPDLVLDAEQEIENTFGAEFQKLFWWSIDPNASYPDYHGESNQERCSCE